MSQILEADRLLSQWAKWSSGELRKLGASVSKWQMDYEAGFQEEGVKSSVPAGDEATMQRVDAALARVRLTNRRHFLVITVVYRSDDDEVEHSRGNLEAAVRAFISEYWQDEQLCRKSVAYG